MARRVRERSALGQRAPVVPLPVTQVIRWGAWLRDLLYLLPILLLTTGVVLVPSAIAVYRSFFDWHPGGASPFVGLANFTALAVSHPFHQILLNEAVFLLGVPFWTLLPLVFALVLYERVPAAGLFRTIFFFPSVLSPPILGILFRSLLAPEGLVNTLLRLVGLGWLAHEWIDSPGLVKPVLIVVLGWASLGVGLVIFSAALGSIPPELFEVADLEGASWAQRLRYVMIPGIRGTVELYVVYQILSVFLFLFGWIYVVTQGGPGYASTTIDYDIYQNAMNYGLFGSAAAESVYLLAAVMIVLGLGTWLVRRRSARIAGRESTHRSPVPAQRLLLAVGAWSRRTWRGYRPAWSWPAGLIRHRPRGRFGSARRRSWSPGRTLFLVLASIPFIYPFYFMAATALKTPSDYLRNALGVPRQLTLDNIVRVWNQSTPDLGHAMLNSLFAVSTGVIVVVCISSAGAYWFVRHRGRLARVLLPVMLGSWIFPLVIWIVPFFVLVSHLGLADRLLVLGVLYGVLNAPFGLYLMYTHYSDSIPFEVVEAASVDGASTWKLFTAIFLPLSKPALAALAALSFVWAWGDLLLAVVMLQDSSHWTLTVAATTVVTRFDAAIQQQAAAALVSIAPLVLVFLVAQRAIVRGFTSGIGK